MMQHRLETGSLTSFHCSLRYGAPPARRTQEMASGTQCLRVRAEIGEIHSKNVGEHPPGSHSVKAGGRNVTGCVGKRLWGTEFPLYQFF